MNFFSLLISKAYAANPLLDLSGLSGHISTQSDVGITAIFQRIYDFLVAIAFPIGFAAIIYISYTLITAQGNPDGYAKSKKYLFYMITGFALIIFASLIVSLILKTFGTSS